MTATLNNDDLRRWHRDWHTLRANVYSVRNLLVAAARGPLDTAQAYRLQVELEAVRAVVCDPLLDTLFLPAHEFREMNAMNDQPTADTNADTAADIADLVAELGKMYVDDPNKNTELEDAYLSYTTAPRVNAIGEELHARGGLAAMGRAHDSILREHGNGAAAMLRVRWCNASVCGWSVGWTLPTTA